ncbi:MAG TPA: SMP-30/gluconolactonase/LRE family protein [Sphingopyxis sp.]|nr:SMP-30/gluconolactonase/LRE family protein [Sphingopyxis sp.]
MIEMPQPEAVVTGLSLPECPRWHGRALYFSDITQGRVYRLNNDFSTTIVYENAEDFVGGIGFLDDATLIAVLSKQRLLVRAGPVKPAVHARLDSLCRFVLNDMAIASNGRAYVSQPGHDIWAGSMSGMPRPTELILADVDGSVAIAADGLMGPNGVAVSSDGGTLYVAESAAMRITCFSIDRATGHLSERRIFAQLPGGAIPDGICLDDTGAVWAACPISFIDGSAGRGPGVMRMLEGGKATHIVPMAPGRRALACTLGGAGRTILYICTVPDFDGTLPDAAGEGRIERVATDFAGSGTP